ncbi:MAG: class I SAM-dependent methyltransferase [Rhodothermaceae bacterium]
MNIIEEKVVKLINENSLSKKIKILELTPGEGNLSRKLYSDGFTNLETLDINPENFQIKEIKCHKGNLNDPLPFEDETYDLVISIEGIEHLEKQYQFAEELNRVLKKNGHLILSTPNIINFASRLRFLLTGFYSLASRPSSEFEKNWVIEHIYPLTFWQLRHILHTNGLFIKKIDADRYRRSSRFWKFMAPLTRFITRKTLLKETDERQKKVNMEITDQMYQNELFSGRTQIVYARKEESDYIKQI